MNLQDAFINQIRTQKHIITLHLTTGEEITGSVRGFDPMVIVMDISDEQRIVYKHAIAYIAPHQSLDLFSSQGKNNETDY